MTSARPALRIVFLFRNFGYVRLFDGVIRELLARGHAIHLLHEREPDGPSEQSWLCDLSAQPGFTFGFTDTIERDRWSALADYLRRAADYAHARSPEFVGGSALVARSEIRVPAHVRKLIDRLARRPGSRTARLLRRALGRLEAAIPTSALLTEEIRGLEPQVLVMAPHLMPPSRHEEYVKAAHAAEVPVCMCIASWDNLTTKQRIRVVPDRVVVWNEIQLREAMELHGVPPERIVVTGAQSFDHWFERRAGPRDAFLNRVGLDARRPYVLFVGGALFPAETTEAAWVLERWLPALRSDERLADVQVLVRPHPRRSDQWRAVSFDGVDNVAVWPRSDAPMPVDEETRGDFFDSIHHSIAVAGINTTALIEAAVVGRPVFTVLEPVFSESQRGTYHFNYLLEIGGGALQAADTMEQHVDDLAAALDDDRGVDREAFLRAFVRPKGLDVPALPFVVDEIERTAGTRPVVPATPWALLCLRCVLRAVIGLSRSARQLRR